jgi:hypothetical protein
VHIVINGLDPDHAVTVGLRSTDANQFAWSSEAVFRSDGSGTVDLASASAISGSNQGVDPMGLIDTLQGADRKDTQYHPTWLKLVRKAAAGRFECACRIVGTWWLMPYRTRMLARVLRWQGSRVVP